MKPTEVSMKKGFAFFLALSTSALMHAVTLAQQPIVAGPNVNIIGGPAKIVKNPDGTFQLLEGDPGQRQNEVSCFVDSRDPLDIGCAYNDYTPVEIAGMNGDGETGDAWIGQSISTDGGFTWRKFMFPGYLQDGSPEGLASPLHGLEAAADPTWVSGPAGVSYLSAIAFNRAATQVGTTGGQANAVVFVQKYINNNNIENDPKPFKPVGDPVTFPANSGEQFQDKPWAGVAPNGDLQLVWATFLGGGKAKPHSAVWRVVCPGGDLRKCSQSKLSEGDFVVNGTILAFQPGTGFADIAFRRRKSSQTRDTDAIMYVRCFTGTNCTKAIVIAEPPDLQRSGDGSLLGALFDQGSGAGIFRNISNPGIATDAARRVYITWAQRLEGKDPATGLVTRDSKIMLMVGQGDRFGFFPKFGVPVTVDSLTDPATRPTGRGHEIRPQMWFGAGRLYISGAILHEDQTLRAYTVERDLDPGRPGPDGIPGTADDGEILKYVATREPKGELVPQPPTAEQLGRAFTEFIYDRAPAQPTLDVAPNFNDPNTPPLKRRHTEEIGLWTGTPAPAGSAPGMPTFTFTNVWRPRIVFRPSSPETPRVGRYEQGEFNPWGLNLFNDGEWAFAGDYDALVTQAFVPNADGTGYVLNTSAASATPAYVAWTDNRNVRPHKASTKDFVPAGASCTSGNSTITGTRNQDVYIVRAGDGLYVYVLGNQKPLGNATFEGETFQIKRAFLIQFQSAVNSTKHYRAVIANQPAGGSASWRQFQQLTQIDLSIPPFSIATRELYASSTDAAATIRVDVFEIMEPGGTQTPGGLQSFTIINPDRTTPTLMPAFNEAGNIDPTDPNSAEIFTPDPLSPDPLSSNVVQPDPLSPDPLSPDPLSPDPLSPDPLSVDPDFVDPTSPDPLSPDPLSPDPLSPDPLSPDPLSPDPLSVPPGGVMTDTSVEVDNSSNTPVAVAVTTFATKNLPAGSRLQVIVTKPYFTTTQRGCELKTVNASPVLATVTDPNLATTVGELTFDPADSSPKNLTVGVPPGGKFFVVYRWVDPDASDNEETTDPATGRTFSVDPNFNPAQDLIPVVIPQPISTPEARLIEGTCGGFEQPPCPTSGDFVAPLSITTTGLADGVVGVEYPTQTLMAIGGEPAPAPAQPYTWSVAGLPTGLSVNSAGVISGTPTVVGTFTVAATVTDSQPVQASRSFTLRIFPRADAGTASTAEDTSKEIMLSADGGGSPLTFTFFNPPDHGTLTGAGPTVTYTPDANYNGADSFEYTVTAASLTSAPATVAITVTPVNDAPVAVDDAFTTPEDTPLVLTQSDLKGNDTDIDNTNAQLTVTSVFGAVNGAVVLNPEGTVTFTPATNFFGTAGFDYVVSDGALSDVGHVTVNVTPVNDAPVAVNDSYSVTQGSALEVPPPGVLANDSDVDSPSLSAVLFNGPSNGTLTLSVNGSFSYVPNPGFVGTDNFTYGASDGSAVSAPATVSIAVNAAPPTPTFFSAYGGSGDIAYSLVRTSDGGYVFAGDTTGLGAVGKDVWVVRTTAAGVPVWQKRLGAGGSEGSSSFSGGRFGLVQVTATNDGGFAIAATIDSFGGTQDAWVAKLDADGNVVWQKAYSGTGSDAATAIVQLADGALAVAGSTTSFGVGGSDAWVLKVTSADGSIVWEKTYGFGGADDYAADIAPTSDGGLAVTGWTYSAGDAGDLWVAKLAADGAVTWNKVYGLSGFDSGFSIVQTSNGGYAVTGGANNAARLLRLNADGTVAWHKVLGPEGSVGEAVIETSDGGLSIAGGTTAFGNGGDAWALKTTSSGVIIWQKRYGGTGFEKAWAIVQTADGNYAIAGQTTSFGSSDDAMLVRLDAAGAVSTCALVADTTVASVDTAVGDISGVSSVATSAFSATSSLTTADTAAVTGQLCPPSPNLSVSITDSPDPVVIGQNLTYSIVVGNASPPASGVVLTVGLAPILSFVSATPGQGTCSHAAGTVTCDLGTLAGGAGTTVNVVTTPTAAGTATTAASATSGEPDANTANNSASATTTVNAFGTASSLVFTTQPSNTAIGDSIAPAVQVAIRDSFGNTVTTATNSIMIAFGANPVGGTLSGTLTKQAVNGVASFSDLSINKAGSGYTLVASSSGFTSVTSAAFRADALLFAGSDNEEFGGQPLPDNLGRFTINGAAKTGGGVIKVPYYINGMGAAGGFLYAGTPQPTGSTPGNVLNKIDYQGTLMSSATGGFPSACCNEDMVFDGTHLWHVHWSDNIQKLDPNTGAVLATYDQTNVVGITRVAGAFWITKWSAQQVGTWDPATNTFTSKFSTAPNNAGGLAYDAVNQILWVGQGGGSVVPYDLTQTPPGALNSGFQPFGAISNTIDGLEFVSEIPLPAIDQQQPTIDTTAGFHWLIGGSTEQKVAQTVTAGVSKFVSEVHLPVSCNPGAVLTVEIRGTVAGTPNDVVMSSATFPGAFTTAEGSFETFRLSNPVFFSAGTQYSIVMRSTSTSAFCHIAVGPVGNPYPGGDSYFQQPSTAWQSLGERADLPFKTLVR